MAQIEMNLLWKMAKSLFIEAKNAGEKRPSDNTLNAKCKSLAIPGEVSRSILADTAMGAGTRPLLLEVLCVDATSESFGLRGIVDAAASVRLSHPTYSSWQDWERNHQWEDRFAEFSVRWYNGSSSQHEARHLAVSADIAQERPTDEKKPTPEHFFRRTWKLSEAHRIPCLSPKLKEGHVRVKHSSGDTGRPSSVAGKMSATAGTSSGKQTVNVLSKPSAPVVPSFPRKITPSPKSGTAKSSAKQSPSTKKRPAAKQSPSTRSRATSAPIKSNLNRRPVSDKKTQKKRKSR